MDLRTLTLAYIYYRINTNIHCIFSFLFNLFSTTHCSILRLIVRSGLDVPTFATRRLHAYHHARVLSGGRWNIGREMSGKFCLSTDFHVTFKDLLHAVKLWHGTDGFTSPPKEGVLRIFFRPKNPTASAGCEPANLGTKGQHATSRPRFFYSILFNVCLWINALPQDGWIV